MMKVVDLPKFNTVFACPVCGTFRYVERFELRACPLPNGESDCRAKWAQMGDAQHVDVVCPRCGWTWAERTARDSA